MNDKKQKAAVLLRGKKGVCYRFLLEHIDGLNLQELEDLLVLLEGKDKKRIKEISESSIKKLRESFLKAVRLAKDGGLLCSKFKRKRQENILNKDLT